MKSRRNLDLQLLACLDALIAECSVTRAAERMGMSQPGMSNALSRLRNLTRDQLLVRTARGMVPTPRARELAGAVQAGMRAFEEVLGDRGPFDPARAQGTVTVAAADFPGMLIFPHVMQRLRTEAPGVSVDLRLPDPLHIREWLTEGACDLVVGFLPDLPPGLRSGLLFEESLTLAAAAAHPTIGERVGLQDLARERHVVFGSPFSNRSTLETMLDADLARQGVVRQVGMHVSSALVTPYVVAQTSLLAILPRVFARHFASFLPLRLPETDFTLPRIGVRMVWHERTHRLGLHAWMRGLIRAVVEAHLKGQVARVHALDHPHAAMDAA